MFLSTDINSHSYLLLRHGKYIRSGPFAKVFKTTRIHSGDLNHSGDFSTSTCNKTANPQLDYDHIKLSCCGMQ